jgi:heptose I phosphotransferase
LNLFLDEPFKSAWQGRDPFAEVASISNAASATSVYRDKEGRRTLRFDFGGRSYFLKHHRGIGWTEILKNIFQLRLPTLGARNEFEAANKLHALGIDTLTPLAYGSRGINPATRESFLITAELVNTISLEDYCLGWKQKLPVPKIKRVLLRRVAETTKRMHENGINHRDYYLCHFLLEQNADEKIRKGNDFRCYLIDLHRCQIRNRVPQRWREKDLAGLFFSSMDEAFSSRDYFRFLRSYTGLPLREALKARRWLKIERMARSLYQKEFGRQPRNIFKRVSHGNV